MSKATPNKTDNSLEKGKALAAGGQYEAAIAVYDDIIKLRPGDAAAYVAKASALQQLGRNAEAAEVVAIAKEVKPGGSLFYYYQAIALQEAAQNPTSTPQKKAQDEARALDYLKRSTQAIQKSSATMTPTVKKFVNNTVSPAKISLLTQFNELAAETASATSSNASLPTQLAVQQSVLTNNILGILTNGTENQVEEESCAKTIAEMQQTIKMAQPLAPATPQKPTTTGSQAGVQSGSSSTSSSAVPAPVVPVPVFTPVPVTPSTPAAKPTATTSTSVLTPAPVVIAKPATSPVTTSVPAPVLTPVPTEASTTSATSTTTSISSSTAAPTPVIGSHHSHHGHKQKLAELQQSIKFIEQELKQIEDPKQNASAALSSSAQPTTGDPKLQLPPKQPLKNPGNDNTATLAILDQQLKKVNQQIAALTAEEDNDERNLVLQNAQLQLGGAIDEANINKQLTYWQQNNKALFAFHQLFYWSLLNLLESYAKSSSGLMQANISTVAKPIDSVIVGGAGTLASAAMIVAKQVPYIGAIVSIINNAINSIDTAVLDNRFGNKVKAINLIIQKNIALEDDLSTVVAKAAFVIAKVSQPSILHPSAVSNSSSSSSAASSLNASVNNINEDNPFLQALGDNSNYITQLAAQDIVSLITYLLAHYDEVLKNNTPLSNLFTNIVLGAPLDTPVAYGDNAESDIPDSAIPHIIIPSTTSATSSAMSAVSVTASATYSNTSAASSTTSASSVTSTPVIAQPGSQGADSTVTINQAEIELQVIKREVTVLQAREEVQEKQLKAEEEIIQNSGVVEKAQIQVGVLTLQQTSPELYAYWSAFYWTTINLFNGYRDLSTGLMVESSNANNPQVHLAVTAADQLAQCGVQLAKNIPIIGSAISLLDTVIDGVYNAYTKRVDTNKVNSINIVIQAKLRTEEEISLTIAQAAILVTKAKQDKILHPDMNHNSSTLSFALDWLKKKIDVIKDKILPPIDLYDKNSPGAQMALQDTATMMTYLWHNCEQVAQSPAPLHLIMGEVVTQGRLEQLLETAAGYLPLDQGVQVIGDNNPAQQHPAGCCAGHCTIL